MPLRAPCGDDGFQACARSISLIIHILSIISTVLSCLLQTTGLNDYCLRQTPAAMMTCYRVDFLPIYNVVVPSFLPTYQSTSPGWTFYLAMFDMIYVPVHILGVIWTLDFSQWTKIAYIYVPGTTGKIPDSCTRSASLMMHLWLNVPPCGDDWGYQVSSAINFQNAEKRHFFLLGDGN